MTRPYRLFGGLSLLILVLATSSWGQSGPQPGGGPSNLYNPDTVVTVSGMVIAKTPPSSKGLPQLVYLTLKTEADKITISTWPSPSSFCWFSTSSCIGARSWLISTT